MVKRKRWAFRDTQPPFPCFFNCGRFLATKMDRQAIEGWEWFCEYGDEVLHFCPICRKSRQYEIDRIREKLHKKPADYPNTFAKL